MLENEGENNYYYFSKDSKFLYSQKEKAEGRKFNRSTSRGTTLTVGILIGSRKRFLIERKIKEGMLLDYLKNVVKKRREEKKKRYRSFALRFKF